MADPHPHGSSTPLDGAWDVAGATGDFAAVDRVFFEKNRAHLVVFRDTTGAYAEHHFEVDRDSVRVWRTWLERDSLLLAGDWDAATITLLDARDPQTTLRLRRR